MKHQLSDLAVKIIGQRHSLSCRIITRLDGAATLQSVRWWHNFEAYAKKFGCAECILVLESLFNISWLISFL